MTGRKPILTARQAYMVLRAKRLRRTLTDKALAFKLGVSERTIRSYNELLRRHHA